MSTPATKDRQKGFASSITGTIAKIKDDAKKIKQNFPDVEILIVATAVGPAVSQRLPRDPLGELLPTALSLPSVARWQRRTELRQCHDKTQLVLLERNLPGFDRLQLPALKFLTYSQPKHRIRRLIDENSEPIFVARDGANEQKLGSFGVYRLWRHDHVRDLDG